jgi:hypothetical protein
VAKEGAVAKEEAVAKAVVGLDDDDDDYCMLVFDVQYDAYYYDHDNIHDDGCSF